MSKKLTLGLLVFFVGVLMAACGDSKSNAGSEPVTNIPKDFENDTNYGCTNCEKKITGKFRGIDHGAYIIAFDKSNPGNLGLSDFDLDIRRDGLANSLVYALEEFIYGAIEDEVFYVICDGVSWRADRAADQGFDVDAECVRADGFGSAVSDDFATTYSSYVELEIDSDNDVTEIRLVINSDKDYDDGSDSMTFFDTSNANVFVNSRDDYILTNTNGRLYLENRAGERVGYFSR